MSEGSTGAVERTDQVASCCSPSLEHDGPRQPRTAAPETDLTAHRMEQRPIPGGRFLMGDNLGDGSPADGELPVHEVHVDPFVIDATTVTNAAFAEFVDATGYVTEAESYDFSAVFHLALEAQDSDVLGAAPGTPWWLGVRGATWRHPGGPLSDLTGLEDHPVVHVSWNDALAYCRWSGRRLPTEAEWELASRGGATGARFPWGDEVKAGTEWRANIWQGDFPVSNTAEDGWTTTAPVRSFAPNSYGLWQTVGNVWEWCADWFDPAYYRVAPSENPTGPAQGTTRVLRGGSYLCHDSYCNRYRNAARSSNTPDSSMGNTGFRTVAATPDVPDTWR
ncbi:formylglycine-generating enzyme required for sulfatase activity [Nocardioides albertanoniae]|uniref:Formylglycine-generating enzyme required for sulfatase activity n=1 Tax=Nocardioides albertanoniae TaxID=1175486 RepID=A0A543ADJ1_9ACTN|nr:formylglycine-generating enzyme family protein [Nocardioides albertanoniae]TQL70653.1 formylglycine-generating enzyme required for sulfatase activity [Nocardioides albertanoniae]